MNTRKKLQSYHNIFWEEQQSSPSQELPTAFRLRSCEEVVGWAFQLMNYSVGPLQLSGHVAKLESKWRTETSHNTSFALPFGNFLPSDSSTAKGPLQIRMKHSHQSFKTIILLLSQHKLNTPILYIFLVTNQRRKKRIDNSGKT